MSGLPLSAGDFWIHRPKIDSRIEYETCRTCATLVPILAVPLNVDFSDSLANRLLSKDRDWSWLSKAVNDMTIVFAAIIVAHLVVWYEVVIKFLYKLEIICNRL